MTAACLMAHDTVGCCGACAAGALIKPVLQRVSVRLQNRPSKVLIAEHTRYLFAPNEP